MSTDRLSTVLDAAGAILLLGFAWFIWPPAALGAAGLALLLISWRMAGAPTPRRRRDTADDPSAGPRFIAAAFDRRRTTRNGGLERRG